jgi:acid phosphatase family membrane protein YuiD
MMIEILLSSILSCAEAQQIAFRIETVKNMSVSVKRDLVRELREASPKNCNLPKIK